MRVRRALRDSIRVLAQGLRPASFPEVSVESRSNPQKEWSRYQLDVRGRDIACVAPRPPSCLEGISDAASRHRHHHARRRRARGSRWSRLARPPVALVPSCVAPRLGPSRGDPPRPSREGAVQIPKATEDDRAWFQALLPDDARGRGEADVRQPRRVRRRQHVRRAVRRHVGVRLADDDREALLADGGRAVRAGRAPDGRLRRAARGVARRSGDGAAVVERAFAYAAAMPPKAPKPRKGKAGA